MALEGVLFLPWTLLMFGSLSERGKEAYRLEATTQRKA